MFQAISGRLRELCTKRPAVVLIDDLHAANRDVLLLTRFIARSLHRFPLLLVATWRFGRSPAVAADEQFDSLMRESTVLDLTPFGEEEIFEYLRACGRSATAAEISALLAVTAGNPLYVTEAVRRPSLRSWSGAESLARAVAQRVAKMERSQYDIVGAAAILGERATVCSVAAMLRRSPADVIAAIDDVGAWVSIRGHEIRFSHDLVRRAFTDAMTTTERQQMHAAAMGEIDEPRRGPGRAPRPPRRRGRWLVSRTCTRRRGRMRTGRRVADPGVGVRAGCRMGSTRLRPGGGSRTTSRRSELCLAHADAVLACWASHRGPSALRASGSAGDDAANDPCLLALAAIGLGGVWVEEQRDELSRRRMLALCRRARRSLPTDESLLAARLTVRIAAEDVYQGRRDDEITSAVDEVRRHGDPAATAEALSLYHHTLLVPDQAARPPADRRRVARRHRVS